MEQLDKFGLSLNSEVKIINTVIKSKWKCDLLIMDEIHRFAAEDFSKAFSCIDYRFIIGLTATLERLDGRHSIIESRCPIIDTISLAEASLNGWVAKYTEYKVIVDVDDLHIYKEYDKQFNEHFAFFNYDFDLMMKCLGKDGYKTKIRLRDERCKDPDKKSEMLKSINYHATAASRALQARKKFINSHPKKLEIVRDIINHRTNKKIITFSSTVSMAEEIGTGFVYSGKDSKAKGRITIDEFSKLQTGVLNTVAKANEGLDIPGLSVGIILGMDSSPTKRIQRTGRVIRAEGDKEAEVFTLVLRGTKEEAWFSRSHPDKNYITIDEENLKHVLNYEDFRVDRKKETPFDFRF